MIAGENQIVVYQPNETVRLDVRLENETVWLTQLKIADLFGVQKAAISKHIKNIFASGELIKEATVSKMETVQAEGGRTVVRVQEFFNLDVIIAVGYRVNSKRATQFRIWATRVLKEFLLRGYSVNSRLNQLEDKMDRRLAKHDDDIAELKDKVDFFVQTKEPPLQGIFYQGRYWDAKSLLIKFIRRAKKELIVIDAYVGVATLDMLAKRGRGVKIELVTHSNGELEESDFEAFAKQCGKFTKTICGICHDRFIIVDGKEVFWTGASLKDAGRLTFARMLVHPSGSAFAESSLRNASHFCGASRQKWAAKSSPVFSPQSARRRRNGGNTAKARKEGVKFATTAMQVKEKDLI